MNKTVNITINGLVFSLEEDAYVRLNGYLEDIKKHFSQFSYGQEVVSDIESRIAEQFQAMIGPKRQVITMNEVNGVIKTMGSVAEIASGEESKSAPQVPIPPKPPTKRRLYRSTDNVMIGGVAAGLASYFDWDVTLMRLLFVALGLTTFYIGPYAIAAYLIFWLVVPKAETASAKLEMRGEDVTIAKLEENAKENAKGGKRSQPLREITAFLGTFIRLAVKVAVILLGIGIAGFAFFGIAFTVMIIAQLLFNSGSPYVDFPIRDIFAGVEYFVLAASVLFLSVIPMIFALLAGISLIRRKVTVGKILSAVMIGIWIIALATTSVIIIREAPKIEDTARSYQETTEQKFELTGFDKIQAADNETVAISYGKDFRVTGISLTKDPDKLKLEQNGDTLIISRETGSRPRICVFCSGRHAEVSITMPALKQVTTDGIARVEVAGFDLDEMSAQASGVSRITFEDLTAKSLSVRVADSARVIVSGRAEKLTAESDDNGRIEAGSVTFNDANIKAAGSSRITLGTGGTITAAGQDVARIIYEGQPKIDSKLSGQSRMTKLIEPQNIETEELH